MRAGHRRDHRGRLPQFSGWPGPHSSAYHGTGFTGADSIVTRVFSAFLVILAAATGPAAAQESFTEVDRIVAVGDVHGDFEQFVTVLRQAGVIDEKNRWTGGKTHLVQTGDVLDRGPDSRKVMDLLRELEDQAQHAGGRVHALIGNHEAMNILGDLRYVSPGEYEAFRGPRAEVLRDRAFKGLTPPEKRGDPDYRSEWDELHPLGWVEHRLAFEGDGEYGSWIRSNDAVVRIDGFLFVHGGISPKYRDRSIAELNELVQKDLEPGSIGSTGAAEDNLGPLWYRGLAADNETLLEPHVDSVLANFEVRHVVIGHTATAGAVMPRFQGKVIMIDVGLSAAYGGPPACLVIEHGAMSALHRGTLVALPTDGDMLPYLEAVAALEPPDSRLRAFLEETTGVKSAGGPGSQLRF